MYIGVAACCSVLQCCYRSVLQCCCRLLQYLGCDKCHQRSPLQCVAVCVAACCSVCCSMLQCVAVLLSFVAIPWIWQKSRTLPHPRAAHHDSECFFVAVCCSVCCIVFCRVCCTVCCRVLQSCCSVCCSVYCSVLQHVAVCCRVVAVLLQYLGCDKCHERFPIRGLLIKTPAVYAPPHLFFFLECL